MNRLLKIAAFAILKPGEEPDVSFVPPLVRRRLSPLQKIFFSLARQVDAPSAGFVFASCDGEDTLTRRIVADFNLDGAVSPNRFSSSVYNAAPGLWSVLTKNTAPYTAIAAGEDTIECGLLETLNACRSDRDAVLIYAEETGAGYGLAVRFSSAVEEAAADVAVRNAPQPGRPIGFDDFCRFLLGAGELGGKWLTLRQLRAA